MESAVPFRGSFNYRSYERFLKHLANTSEPTHVVVDMAQVKGAYATGMAPLVATVRHLHQVGWSFDLVLPEDDHLAELFFKLGWVQGFAGDELPHLVPGRTFVPLSSYTNHEELNPLVNAMIEHLVTTQSLPAGVLDAFGWSLNEVADNVLLHSGDEPRGWIQMTQQRRKQLIEFVVVDTGRGISASLSGVLPGMDDRERLLAAVERGVTRDPAIGQGNGLWGTVSIAAAAHGWANLHSGEGQLRVMPDEMFADPSAKHQGTLVEVTLPTGQPIDIASALWGYEPLHELEMDYLQAGGAGVLVQLRDEASGFGNRASAKPVRLKVANLMNQFPSELVTLDFEGATMLSASFADELVARLVKEVGPTRFFAQVRLVNLSELARRTIDAVIAQRLAISDP